MPSDLNLRVLTDGDTRGLEKTARALDDLADKTDDAAKSTKGLGAEADVAGKKTEGFGKRSRQASEDVRSLDGRIVDLKASLKALAVELERDSGNNNLLKKFRADSRELQGLERTRKQITSLSGDVLDLGKKAAGTASTFSSLFQGGAISALKSPAGAAVAAAVGVPAVIGAGALAGGAVTAGVGAGVVGAGIAGAASGSQAVRAEWDDTTAHIKARFLDATTAFEKPTIAAIGQIRDAVDDVDLEKIFGNAAKLVEPVAEGTAIAIRTLGGSVEYVTERAGPAMEALGGAIAEVASGIDIAMREIADGSEGGAEAIQDFGHGISMLIAGGGKFIGWLEDAYAALDDFTQALGDVYPPLDALQDFWGVSDDTVTVLTDLSRETVYAADSMQIMGKETYNTADAADAANASFDRLFGEMMSLDEANLAVKEGMIKLREELGENSKTLKDTTQAGIDNQQAILGQIELYDRQRRAAIEAGNGTKEATDAANAAYAQNVESLKRVLIQMGFTAAEVDNLIAKYKQIPKDISTNVNTYYHNYYSSSGSKFDSPEARQGRQGHARGTMSAPAGWAWVGEEGPELMQFRGGERVVDAMNSRQMAMAGMAPGGGAQRIELVLATQPGAQDAVAEMINELARTGYLQIKASAVV